MKSPKQHDCFLFLMRKISTKAKTFFLFIDKQLTMVTDFVGSSRIVIEPSEIHKTCHDFELSPSPLRRVKKRRKSDIYNIVWRRN
jgi:hypothetical protein